MRRGLGVSIAVAVAACALPVAATADKAHVVPNGNFEAGDFSGGWTTFNSNSNTANWRVYNPTTRTTPVYDPVEPTPPFPRGEWSSQLSMAGPGHNYVTRTVTVPKKARKIAFGIWWANLQSGVFTWNGTWSPSGPGTNQYWSVDLLHEGSEPDTADAADIAKHLFAPINQASPPRRVAPSTSYETLELTPRRGNGPGTTPPFSDGWVRVAVDVTDLQGETVEFRLVEVDNAGINQVGIDNVRFKAPVE